MDCGTESKSYPTVTDEWIDNNTLSRPDAWVLHIFKFVFNLTMYIFSWGNNYNF